MTILIDTSAYSGFRRGHPGLVSLFQSTPRYFVSVVVLGELETGFRRGQRLARNQNELASFLASPRAQVVDVDVISASRYSEILAYLLTQGTPLPTNDVWIAAHAMQHGLQVVTLDAHFQKMPQVSTLLFPP